MSTVAEEKVSFLSFLPKDTLLVVKDFLYVRDAVDRAYQEGFSSQAKMEQMEGATEMERREIELQMCRELQLVTGAQFMADASSFCLCSANSTESTSVEVSDL